LSSEFWLDKVVRRSRIPYPIFFGLMAVFLYLLNMPFMYVSGNLRSFFFEPRWVIVTVFGALNGILIIFTFREFSGSLLRIRHLISSDHADLERMSDRLSGHLTSRAYWLIVIFWLALNFAESPQRMRWWWFYNQPNLVTVYELIETLPCCILGGIFMYMVPVGLTLAYRDLCSKTAFKNDLLLSEWMKPFKGFRRFISLTMFGAVIYALFPPIIWGSTAEPAAAGHWSLFIPYTSIAIVLVSAVLLPHYFFHELFPNAKDCRLEELGSKISQAPPETEKGILGRILLLLEKGELERLSTWLLDVKIVGEVLVVALMHVILVEALTMLIRG